MKEIIVGIDLGTTNSAVAAVVDGKIKVIPVDGQPTMPSCVGLDASGKLIVGQAARNQIVAAPERTISSIKRRMGENIKVALGDREFTPEEVSSFILRRLKEEAEKALGVPVRKAVITVPAYFNEAQRKATQVAGELADLEVVRILNEPTAAALAYRGDRTDDETMLVYDLGGGTFDVSLVVVEDGVVEVKSSHGDTRLGGDDFDELLVQSVVEAFRKEHNVDLAEDPRVLRRLKVVLEQAKCRLSDEPFVRVREEYITPTKHLDHEIARSDYEEMILPLLERTLTCVHQTLEDAKLPPAALDKVMLVGGSTRTPLVHRLLEERLDLEPRWEIDPDLIVAMGAATQAAILAGEPQHSILVDITPHTFSTGVLMGSFLDGRIGCVPIIPRNTPLPARKAEVFGTVADNQRVVEVTVYQGESLDPEENVLIGSFLVEGLSDAPAGNEVVIHFDLDLNGMLKVTATEKATGLSKSVTLDTRGARSHVDVEQARRNIRSLIEDLEEPQGPEAEADNLIDLVDAVAEGDTGTDTGSGRAVRPAQPAAGAAAQPSPAATGVTESSDALLAAARDLRKRGEGLLERNIPPEDAEEVRTLLHEMAVAIRERDWATLAAKNDALSDLLFFLED